MSAPTALAVDLATGCGLSLVGFLRDDRHVVYSHAWRLGLR
jgi:FdhD protein